MRFAFALSCGLVLAAAPTACTATTDHCDPPAGGCPRSTFATELTSGSVDYQLGTAPMTVASVRAGVGAEPVGTCSFSSAGEAAPNGSLIAAVPTVHCTLPNGYVFISLAGLGDPRSWPIGVRTLSNASLNLAEAGLVMETCQAAPTARGCTPCRQSLANVTLTITVDKASGGAAPYPNLVSADYGRTYRIELDAALGASPSDCPVSVSKLSLSLAQTAADYVYEPHGVCPPCGG